MQILQTPVRLFSTGGVENYVCQLSRELVNIGHEVKIVCAKTPVEQKVDDRISVNALWTLGKIANTNITPALPLALMKEDFDILHTHIPTPWSADWSAMTARFKDRPLVLTYHSDIMGKGMATHIAKAYNMTALKLLLESADRIIVARHGYLSSYLQGYRKKIVVMPIGVDADAFKPCNDEEIGDIFFLSVLDEFHDFKGLDVLLRAVKIVKNKMPQVKLIVGGSGTLVDRYRKLAISLGIAGNVDFVGQIPAERLVDYYNGCRLFVLPSTDPSRETFGIVLIEALACGRPVVATDIAGAADDVQETCAGIIVKPRDEVGLAKAILHILKDEALAKRMGSFGRRLIEEKYSWRSVAWQIEKIYEELI